MSDGQDSGGGSTSGRIGKFVKSFLDRLRTPRSRLPDEGASSIPELLSSRPGGLLRLLGAEQAGEPAVVPPEGGGSASGRSPGGGGGTPSGTGSPELAGARPGRVGEYRVLREVGRGGMGVVYEAVQESLGRRVALKVLPFQSLVDSRLLERFRREAQAAAKLQHPNIVPVYGLGEEAGAHYFAMQFVEGRGLHEVLAGVRRLRGLPDTEAGAAGAPPSPRGELSEHLARRLLGESVRPDATTANVAPAEAGPPAGGARGEARLARAADRPATPAQVDPSAAYHRRIARLIQQAGEALDYAHRCGILHRDVKPSNLMVDERDNVWVTDFGLVKDEAVGDLTLPGEILGTLPYMAPERFRGVSDRRGDVYGLGVTLYELLALRPAYWAEDRSRLMKKILDEEPLPLRRIDRAIPRDLERITMKAIRKDPADRYETAGELAQDLGRFLRGLPVRAGSDGFALVARHLIKRHPVVVALLLVGTLAAATFVGWRAVTSRIAKGPNFVLAQDMDGDGDLDLATTNWESGNLSVVLDPGRAGGRVRTHGVGPLPLAIAAADWNGDGLPDLAVPHGDDEAGTISLLLSQGGGRFAAAPPLAVEHVLFYIAAADVDGDQETDLVAVGSSDRVFVFQSLGDGRFEEPTELEAAGGVTFVAAADICRRDGRLDVVTANAESETISVLENEGGRVFAAAKRYPAGGMAMHLAAADLDGDGDLDLATANYSSDDCSVLRNRGDGTFQEPAKHPMSGPVQCVASADLDGDRDQDLVLAGGDDHVEALYNEGDATFPRHVTLSVKGRPSFVAPCDWDGDGDVDLLISTMETSSVAVLVNDAKEFREGDRISISPW